MNKSLDELVKTLNEDDFKYTRQSFSTEEKFNLVKQKRVYPYDYMSSKDRFNERQLPSQEEFYNTQIRKSLKSNIIMRNKYGIPLTVRPWKIIMIYTSKRMAYY